jgi:hypothetical protein
MGGTVLALMIADIKRVSQLFQGLKSADMLDILSVYFYTDLLDGLYGNFSFH